MALSGAGCRGALCRLGPGPAAGLSRCRRPLEPRPARGAPRSPVRCLSAKAGSRSVLAALASKAKRINGRYERFLERTFPRFYVLHATFTKGIQALFLEVKEIRKIKSKMSCQRLSAQQLPYREMERLRQFRRDVIKAIPIGVIAIPPFANFLVIVLMYFFPRQLLIRHFWTPSQQVEFLDAYDAIRRDSYPDVVESLALAARSLPEPQLQKRLQELCAQVQRGSQPRVAELYAVRSLFSGSPLGLNKLQVSHVVPASVGPSARSEPSCTPELAPATCVQPRTELVFLDACSPLRSLGQAAELGKALSQVLFLTPHLPAFFLRRRLRSHVLEIRHLDRAMLRLGLGQLSEEELKAACYLRGLNPTCLGMSECRAWLEQWLGLSCKLQASEASLLANSMVLLSLNYVGAKE